MTGLMRERIHIGKDVVLSSGYQGLISWRPEEKHTTLHGLPLKNAGYTQFVVHPTLPALFEALKQPGALQDSILTWMSDQARGTYANGGFVEPHLRRSFEDDFAALLPVEYTPVS